MDKAIIERRSEKQEYLIGKMQVVSGGSLNMKQKVDPVRELDIWCVSLSLTLYTV